MAMPPPLSPRLIQIGVVARAIDVTPDTIRHYERLGLIEPASRSSGGFRLYREDALRRAFVIQASLQAGFTLAELAGVFAERRRGRAPCRRVRALAAAKLASVDAELVRLHTLRRALAGTLAAWDLQLQSTSPGQMAGLLESLADAMARRTHSWPQRHASLRRRKVA
jgi:DNA-binding transcriptional MerR regulator